MSKKGEESMMMMMMIIIITITRRPRIFSTANTKASHRT